MKKVNLADKLEHDEQSYYLPHHGVLKPSSSTTKLRVVFDASANVQQNLFNIILRFRKYRIAITADIAKMYRQVKINPEQTKFLKILWRNNPLESISTYELQTVTYGTASAPYLATRALRQLTIDEFENNPVAAKIAQNDFYVDDILTGGNSVKDVINLKNNLVSLLESGGFKLHKWCSNSNEVLSTIAVKDREVLKDGDSIDHESMKALGLKWSPKRDTFSFDIQYSANSSPITKRVILSQIGRIYDPLGLISPIVVTAKLIIQELWKIQSNWDEIVPLEIATEWENFSSQLPILQEINLPRCIIPYPATEIEIHGFADASEKAYGACIYLKCKIQNQVSHVSLVCSKTRVAPLKKISLPRLELCAALLLSRLVATILEALDLKIDKITLYSDSTITLHWIHLEPYKLKTFIANRVNEIQELTKKFVWKHVATELNPADVISRGVPPNELVNLQTWWNGPQFLFNDSSEDLLFIEKFNNLKFDSNLLELKPQQHCLMNVGDDEIFTRFSSLTKLIRIVALCTRFFQNCKTKEKIFGPLSASDLDAALKRLVKIVQQNEFKLDIRSLIDKKCIYSQSKLKSLNPFVEESTGLLRVGGRLSKSDLAYDVMHQMLLPSNHPFTNLIYRYEHLKNFHAPPQLLMSIVRQRFWPLKAKNVAKNIVRNCITCFKNNPKLSEQIMGDLPSQRFMPNIPFNTTGVDLCGPFYIKNKNQRKGTFHKIYVASFICFVSKAIHLEIVSDLTSEGFLACLKRFVFRRGKPTTLWSDNATNFKGCQNEMNRNLKEFINSRSDEEIMTYCSTEGIDWKFIPPRAPNFGGLWEASVKSFKYLLKRLTNSLVFTYEEFNTIIIQIEGIMNSRPLSEMSTDPSDPQPLTPAHFLIGKPIIAIPEPSYETIPSNRLKAWRKISQLIQSFWKRFSLEYVHSLQQRNKWKNNVPNINVNDVVLIADESPSTKWLVGLVVDVIPGKDNKVRVLSIKTKSGIKTRSITKIAKLPIE